MSKDEIKKVLKSGPACCWMIADLSDANLGTIRNQAGKLNRAGEVITAWHVCEYSSFPHKVYGI